MVYLKLKVTWWFMTLVELDPALDDVHFYSKYYHIILVSTSGKIPCTNVLFSGIYWYIIAISIHHGRHYRILLKIKNFCLVSNILKYILQNSLYKCVIFQNSSWSSSLDMMKDYQFLSCFPYTEVKQFGISTEHCKARILPWTNWANHGGRYLL